MRWLFGVTVIFSMVVFFMPMSGGVPVVPDKLVHLTIFAALAGAGSLGGFRLGPLIVGLLAYTVATEVIQGVLPIGRAADWRDSVADAIGIAVGLLAAEAVLALSARIAAYRAGVRPRAEDKPEHLR
jgi:hypothetical protein